MVDFEITQKVANHQVNDEYYCVVCQFTEDDDHFFSRQQNWLPKDNEAFNLTRLLYGMSPTFRDLIDAEFGEKYSEPERATRPEIGEQLETTREKVSYVLKNHEEARNDDDFLIWFIREFIEEIDQRNYGEIAANSPSLNEIIETRKQIQRRGKYMPTKPEVLDQRFNIQEVKTYYEDQGQDEKVQELEDYIQSRA